jgi:hypothetical protein
MIVSGCDGFKDSPDGAEISKIALLGPLSDLVKPTNSRWLQARL